MRDFDTDLCWGVSGEGGRRLVVIDDGGFGFNRSFKWWRPFLWKDEHLPGSQGRSTDTFETFMENLASRNQGEFVKRYLQNTWIVIKASHWIDVQDTPLMQFLDTFDVLRRTIVIVSGHSLRGGLVHFAETPGIKLSKTVSWERTYRDFVSAVHSGKLKSLTRCRHLVVRLGMEGALHYARGIGAEPSAADGAANHGEGDIAMWFDRERIEGEYAEAIDLGRMDGLTTVFTAAIVSQIARILGSQPRHELDEALAKTIRKGIPYALSCTRRYFDLGYGPAIETVRKFERLQLPFSQIFSRARVVGCQNEGRHSFSCFQVSGGDLPIEDILSDRWSILSTQLGTKSAVEGAGPDGSVRLAHDSLILRAVNATRLGRDIVVFGPEKAFERSGIQVPYARIKELFTVDRHEIEGLRSIRNLFAEYVRHQERNTPLSVAVFGPPGSGKSFGVEQIAHAVSTMPIRKYVFNLAQFSNFAEVTRLLLQVRDAGLDGKLPLVFFDEFDTPMGDRPLGWLKCFLAPMQDGKFQHGDDMLGLGKAILVFAGGIAPDHESFSNDDFWPSTLGYPDQKGLFVSAKGPDFHSRLRGFLNIIGINPSHLSRKPPSIVVSSDSQADSSEATAAYKNEDFAYIIRRAIIVRQQIEKLQSKGNTPLLDVDNYVEVDRDVMDAMLLTRKYNHGVRSLFAIFEMSTLYGAQVLSKTVLPAERQLRMHVDDTFYKLLSRNYDALDDYVLQNIICELSKA